MGFSTSAAVAVVSIGFLISVGLLYPAIEGTVTDVSEASAGQQDRILDAQNSDAEIQNATYNTTDDTLTVTVQNTGTVTMQTSNTDLLIDGRLETDRTVRVDGQPDRELWVGGETLTLETTEAQAPDRIVVVTDTGLMRSTETIEVVS